MYQLNGVDLFCFDLIHFKYIVDNVARDVCLELHLEKWRQFDVKACTLNWRHLRTLAKLTQCLLFHVAFQRLMAGFYQTVICGISKNFDLICRISPVCGTDLVCETTAWVSQTTPYARSFRRRFFVYHQTVKHPHTRIILSWLSIPLVLKCAAKCLKIGLQIKN